MHSKIFNPLLAPVALYVKYALFLKHETIIDIFCIIPLPLHFNNMDNTLLNSVMDIFRKSLKTVVFSKENESKLFHFL